MYDDIIIFGWILSIYLIIVIFMKYFDGIEFQFICLKRMMILLVLSCYFIYVLKPVNAFLWGMIMYDDIIVFGCNVVNLPWNNDICDKC